MYLNDVDLSKITYYPSHNVYLTVKKIIDIINSPRELVYARELAEQVLINIPDRNSLRDISTITNYVRNTIRFTHDIKGIETVKTVERIYNEIRNTGKFIGDCDDATVLLGAMLKSIGYPIKIVIVSLRELKGDNFNHIYLRVLDKNKNVWYNVDGTMRGQPFNAIRPYKKIKFFEV